MMRWRFQDDVTSALYTMVANPRRMGALTRPAKSTTEIGRDGIVRIVRAPSPAFPWVFEGRTHTEQEHIDLLDWGMRERIIVRDHLNREHLVIPQGFTPTPVVARSNGTRNPWVQEYTFKTIYLRRVS